MNNVFEQSKLNNVFDSINLDQDGIREFSSDRAYNIDEESYDAIYKRGINVDQISAQGKAFKDFSENFGISNSGPLLEVGCGTGRLTSVILASGLFDQILVTDGSKAFTRITRRNMNTLHEHGIGRNIDLEYGCLVDSDFNKLPDDFFASVSMYAVLHHFLDWRKSIRDIKSKIKPGGSLFFGEPCYDFMLISGLLSKSFSYFAGQAGIELNEESQKKLRAMANAAKLRCSYAEAPKVKQEDKHAFRIDDIISEGQKSGYEVSYFPNGNFSNPENKGFNFYKTAFHRFAVVNSFSEELLQQMDGFLNETLDYLNDVASSGAGPFFDCIYILKRIN